MTTFLALSDNGKFSLGSEYNAMRFREFLRKNPGMRLKIEPQIPESKNQRRFFEGAVVPLITFYQEGMDYRNSEDCKKIHQWLKQEFNGELIEIEGRVAKIGMSTKGKLNKGFLERVLDWMGENGYQIEVLIPQEYERWRDEIYLHGGLETYIDYLVAKGILRKQT